MADIRTLKLQLLADTAQFSTGLDKAATDTTSFTNKVDKVVANAAKAFLETDSANTIYSVKRLMGKSYKDIQNKQEKLS